MVLQPAAIEWENSQHKNVVQRIKSKLERKFEKIQNRMWDRSHLQLRRRRNGNATVTTFSMSNQNSALGLYFRDGGWADRGTVSFRGECLVS